MKQGLLAPEDVVSIPLFCVKIEHANVGRGAEKAPLFFLKNVQLGSSESAPAVASRAACLRCLRASFLRSLSLALSSMDITLSGMVFPKRLKYICSINSGSGGFHGCCFSLASLPNL